MINEHKKGVKAVKYTTKPRNFVAKNATSAGAGAHKDKKKAVKQGNVKHKKAEFAESYEAHLARRLEEATVNSQFINVQVTKILAREAQRMTNAPIEQLLAPLMKEYNLTLQQINSMVPGGLKKAAGEYGVMVKAQGVAEGKYSNVIHTTDRSAEKEQRELKHKQAVANSAKVLKNHADALDPAEIDLLTRYNLHHRGKPGVRFDRLDNEKAQQLIQNVLRFNKSGVAEGFFGDIKQSFATGMTDKLKKAIPAQYHKHYDFDSVKSPGDTKAMVARARAAGHLKESGVAEDVDQDKKVFKDKSGKPVGEIGIDPESSPGNGEWYVHHYATGYSVVGFDSAAEAKRELMYVHKHPDAVEGHPSTKEQGMAEEFEIGPASPGQKIQRGYRRGEDKDFLSWRVDVATRKIPRDKEHINDLKNFLANLEIYASYSVASDYSDTGSSGRQKDKAKAQRLIPNIKADIARLESGDGKQDTAEAVDPNAPFNYDAWSKSGKKPRKPAGLGGRKMRDPAMQRDAERSHQKKVKDLGEDYILSLEQALAATINEAANGITGPGRMRDPCESTSARDNWNKASAAREKKHDKIETDRKKAPPGSGMTTAINRLEKQLNKK